MKVKFNRYERIAGLFVLTAVIGTCAALMGMAVKKGWFETKVKFVTKMKNAEGLREGTLIEMAGLRAGSVSEIELRSNNEILVRMEISERFHERIRKDSVVRAIRPFVIGEKILEVSVGSDEVPMLVAGNEIRNVPTMDVMDLVSGKALGPYMESLGMMADNLKHVAQALLDPERSKALIRMFDDLQPLVRNASSLTKEAAVVMRDVNKDKRLSRLVANLDTVSTEVAKMMPVLVKESPEMAEDLKRIAHNVAVLSEELQKTLPILQEIGPEVPRASRRAMEALDETVVTLKALQKSFLLRGNVRDVRDEEALRMPAQEKH
jgi:phospholipid/cholesterol/gamma-HCH transport system substrate-binding protein